MLTPAARPPSVAQNWNSLRPATVIFLAATPAVESAQEPPAGPQVTTGCGETVSVAKLTMTDADVMSVRYGYRVSVGVAALTAGMPRHAASAAAAAMARYGRR